MELLAERDACHPLSSKHEAGVEQLLHPRVFVASGVSSTVDDTGHRCSGSNRGSPGRSGTAPLHQPWRRSAESRACIRSDACSICCTFHSECRAHQPGGIRYSRGTLHCSSERLILRPEPCRPDHRPCKSRHSPLANRDRWRGSAGTPRIAGRYSRPYRHSHRPPYRGRSRGTSSAASSRRPRNSADRPHTFDRLCHCCRKSS